MGIVGADAVEQLLAAAGAESVDDIPQPVGIESVLRQPGAGGIGRAVVAKLEEAYLRIVDKLLRAYVIPPPDGVIENEKMLASKSLRNLFSLAHIVAEKIPYVLVLERPHEIFPAVAR